MASPLSPSPSEQPQPQSSSSSSSFFSFPSFSIDRQVGRFITVWSAASVVTIGLIEGLARNTERNLIIPKFPQSKPTLKSSSPVFVDPPKVLPFASRLKLYGFACTSSLIAGYLLVKASNLFQAKPTDTYDVEKPTTWKPEPKIPK